MHIDVVRGRTEGVNQYLFGEGTEPRSLQIIFWGEIGHTNKGCVGGERMGRANQCNVRRERGVHNIYVVCLWVVKRTAQNIVLWGIGEETPAQTCKTHKIKITNKKQKQNKTYKQKTTHKHNAHKNKTQNVQAKQSAQTRQNKTKKHPH